MNIQHSRRSQSACRAAVGHCHAVVVRSSIVHRKLAEPRTLVARRKPAGQIHSARLVRVEPESSGHEWRQHAGELPTHLAAEWIAACAELETAEPARTSHREM